MMIALDVTSLKMAVSQLGEGLARAESSPEDQLVRDGVIQRFKYTYELSHKMLRRFLELTEPNPDMFDEITFQSLIRLGSERGLLVNGWDVWRNFRDARGTTSRTYDKNKAEEVFEQIPAFLDEARYLLAKLEARIAAS